MQSTHLFLLIGLLLVSVFVYFIVKNAHEYLLKKYTIKKIFDLLASIKDEGKEMKKIQLARNLLENAALIRIDTLRENTNLSVTHNEDNTTTTVTKKEGPESQEEGKQMDTQDNTPTTVENR